MNSVFSEGIPPGDSNEDDASRANRPEERNCPRPRTKVRLQTDLAPKNGRLLLVLCICRISGDNQDELSLDDQFALLKEWVEQRFDGAVEYVQIAGKGSGEVLDRLEAIRVEQEVATGRYDLVIAEDLGRIYRRLQALIFCEICLDEGTRVVAINDHIDTSDEGWRMHGLFAVARHESYNVDTAKRIRRTLRHRFANGGIVQTLIPGYIKPLGAKSDSEVQKDPAFEAVYEKWFELLEGGASYSEVADWLNANNVPLSKYARAEHWNCSMVTRITNNPMLKGVRQRNRRISVRINRTGRRKQVNAPLDDLLERSCPHLAFIDPQRYDRLIDSLRRKNRHFRRKLVDGIDPRHNVPKKRTRWPGQHVYCGCCGSLFVYGAHGQTEHLICSGAKSYKCWMSMSVDGPKAREKLGAAILARLESLPDFTPELMQAVIIESRVRDGKDEDRLCALNAELATIEAKLKRFASTIGEYGASATLFASVRQLESQQLLLLTERDKINNRPEYDVPIPSANEVRQRVNGALGSLLNHDPVAIRLLHALIPSIIVHPFRAVDGGHPVLRASFSLNIAAVEPQLGELTVLGHPWHTSLTVDLFDEPKRRAIRNDFQRLKLAGMNYRQIATELQVTLPVVHQAKSLIARMDAMGLTDPYQRLVGPPADYSKLRRHLHPRFRDAKDEDEAA